MTREELLSWASEGFDDPDKALMIEGNPPRPKETKMQKPDTMVADELRKIMLDEPSRFEKDALAKWASTPVFRKRGSTEPWGRHSYAAAWATVCSVVPGISRMWVRDLRATAKTWLRKSGISTPVVMRFLGHAATVHEGYDNVDADDLRAAAEALRPKTLAAYYDERKQQPQVQ